MRLQIASLLTAYGWLVAQPFLAAIWLLALYAFWSSLGAPGVWVWTIPTVIAVFSLAIIHQPSETEHG